jgi:ABC-type Mn2+/Zn2+ transport system permease subunit
MKKIITLFLPSNKFAAIPTKSVSTDWFVFREGGICTYSREFIRRLTVFALFALCILPVIVSAQAPPPPPPTEGLNPDTAPATSTETVTHTKDSDHAEHADTLSQHQAEHTTSTLNDISPLSIFKLDFMQRALIAGLLVGGICAYIGIYVVLRRVIFVGIALSEIASAGVALSMLLNIPAMIGSVGMMLAGVGLVSVRWGGRQVRQDAFIGIGYVVASALGVLLIAKSPQGEGHLMDILFGNVLTITTTDIAVTGVALLLVLVTHAAFAKELLFVSFDPDTAQAAGYNSRLWELLLYVLIGLTIAFSIHAVGVLLTFASLLLPAVTALLVTRRMPKAFMVAVGAGLLPVPIGLYLSFIWDLPSAATIVMVSFLLLLLAGIIGKRR